MMLLEGRDFRRGGILVGSWPAGPDPEIAVAPVEVIPKRAIGGRSVEALALLPDEVLKRQGAWGAGMAKELAEQELEEEALEAPDAFVFDEGRVSQFGELAANRVRCGELSDDGGRGEFGNALHVDIEWIAKEGRVGEVGAGIVGLPVLDGVQRVERQEAAVEVFLEPAEEVFEVSEVAAPPVALGAHAVETDGNPGEASARFQIMWQPGAIGGDDEAALMAGLAGDGGLNLVVPKGERRVWPEVGFFDVLFARDSGFRGLR